MKVTKIIEYTEYWLLEFFNKIGATKYWNIFSKNDTNISEEF